MAVIRNLGFESLVFPKANYNTTGSAISFQSGSQKQRSAYVAIKNHTGICLISLDGSSSAPFIELGVGEGFSFPLQTTGLFIKSSTGTTDVSVVIGLHPIDSKIL